MRTPRFSLQGLVLVAVAVLGGLLRAGDILNALLNAAAFFSLASAAYTTVGFLALWALLEIALRLFGVRWRVADSNVNTRLRGLGWKPRAALIGMVLLPWLALLIAPGARSADAHMTGTSNSAAALAAAGVDKSSEQSKENSRSSADSAEATRKILQTVEKLSAKLGPAQNNLERLKQPSPAQTRSLSEQDLWQSIRQSDVPDLFELYATKYPDGPHASAARNKATALRMVSQQKQDRPLEAASAGERLSASKDSNAERSPTDNIAPELHISVEREVRRTIDTYISAMEAMDIVALELIFPTAPTRLKDAVRENRKNCTSFQVAMGEPSIFEDRNAGTAVVEVQSQYVCNPKSAKQKFIVTVADVFHVRRLLSGTWVIDAINDH